MRSMILLAATALASATPAAAQTLPASNPFAKPSTLPFQAPPFDRIKDSDYQPALEAGMAEQLREIQKIANNPAPPTFDNTIAAMERSGRLLDRTTSAFFAILGTDTSPALQKVQSSEAPRLAAHQDAITLNSKLFARVKSLHDRSASLGLTPEQAQVLKLTYENFIRAGAQLSDADKTTLRDLNKQLSTLSTDFDQKLLAGTKEGALSVADKAKLAGLSEAELAAAAVDAKERGQAGKWLLPLQNTTQQPSLASMTDRATREALFNNSWTRSEKGDANDTRATISELAQLRAKKAKLLGFPTYADYVLQNQMAKSPATANAFMRKLGTPVAAEERREAAVLQQQIKTTGGDFDLKPWDWDLYSEQVRKAKYDLDQDQLKPYFEINKVLNDGVFYAAN